MAPNKPFKRIALMGRQRQNGTSDTLMALYHHLTDRGYDVKFEAETASYVAPHQVTSVPTKMLHSTSDLLIVVGGDGSLLHAAQLAVAQALPVLGVNRGRLGFLTDMHPNDFSKIETVLQGHYHEEERFLLRADVKKDETTVAFTEGLNEIMLFSPNRAHMIDFDVTVNEQFLCSLRADGLVIATPTGSTAYALSGGGPIVHPELDAIAMVPICPHTLTNRPIVIHANSHITIHVNSEIHACISSDGRQHIPISTGNTLHIQKKSTPLRLVHPLDYDYFEALRAKLHWQRKHIC